MQKQIGSVLQQELTRKEFFLVLGYGVAAIAGIGTLLQMFGKDIRPEQLKQVAGTNKGYGISAYGR